MTVFALKILLKRSIKLQSPWKKLFFVCTQLFPKPFSTSSEGFLASIQQPPPLSSHHPSHHTPPHHTTPHHTTPHHTTPHHTTPHHTTPNHTTPHHLPYTATLITSLTSTQSRTKIRTNKFQSTNTYHYQGGKNTVPILKK